MKNIIKSLLDTDLYKLTMLWVFYLKYNLYYASYKYTCRSDHDLLPYKEEIKSELDAVCKLKFQQSELEWLRKIPFFPNVFIDFLETFQLKRKHIYVNEHNGKLNIWVEGPIINVMMFEIYVLKIVSEVYTRNNCDEADRLIAMDELKIKCEMINRHVTYENSNFTFADFGSRRAFSAHHHEEVVKYMKEQLPSKCFVGTSNLYLAKKYDLKPIGSQAHEYQSFFQALVHPLDSVKKSLDVWSEVYRGSLGIALTDTLGVDKFLRDFDLYFANLFDGVRHDSGCAYTFTDKIVKHYQNLGIDPLTKTIIFSDGLTMKKAFDLGLYCERKGIKYSFGIGTHLTFDIPKVLPVQSVMKIMCVSYENDLRPVCKLSDTPEKAMGGCQYQIDYIINELGL